MSRIRLRQGPPLGVRELFGADLRTNPGGREKRGLSGIITPKRSRRFTQRSAELFTSVHKSIASQLKKPATLFRRQRRSTGAPIQPDDGRAHFRPRPKTGGFHGTHESHIVIELQPDPGLATRISVGRGAEALGHLGLNQDGKGTGRKGV